MKAYVDGHPAKLCVLMEDGRKIIRDATSPHTNNEAEYLAVLLAVKLGATVVYSDSGLVVNQLNGTFKIREPRLLYLWGEVMKAAGDGNLVAKSERVKFIWIPRTENPAGRVLA